MQLSFWKSDPVPVPADITKEHIEQYLASKRCVLWGRAFDINHPDTRKNAANWLYSVVRDVQLIAEAK